MQKLITILLAVFSFSTVSAQTLKWYTVDEAIAASDSLPKKVLIYATSDGCPHCRIMENQTLTNAAVINYLNTHYYPVKLNISHPIVISEQNTQHPIVQLIQSNAMGTGVPATAFLTEQFQLIDVLRGRKQAAVFLPYLFFCGHEYYKQMAKDDFFILKWPELKNTPAGSNT